MCTVMRVLFHIQTLISRLHRLSTWWPLQTDHTSPIIVDVPLAPGKLRNAAGGAPGDDDDLIPVEDYVSRALLLPPIPAHAQGAAGILLMNLFLSVS